MKVKVVSNALMNVDRPFLVHAKFFIEKLQEQYPYEYEVSKVDDSYSDEVVNVLFYNHDATDTADDIVVVTNYRIFSVDKVDDFTSHNFNVRAHSFIDTVREIEYKKIYIEVDTGDTWYNLRSNDDYCDQ